MSDQTQPRAAVRRPSLKGKPPATSLSVVRGICNAAEQCQEVQASPTAAPALAALRGTLDAAEQSHGQRVALAQALVVAIKGLHLDLRRLRAALGTFASTVDDLAAGNGVIISKAGFQTRDPRAAAEELSKVVGVTSKPGKIPRQAVVSWPEAPGAQAYAIEVSDSGNPSGPTRALPSGTRRTRVVNVPAPGGQILVRVAALAGDGTQAEWSDWALATAR